MQIYNLDLHPALYGDTWKAVTVKRGFIVDHLLTIFSL